ncbi:MAG TPA: OB-fold domain-containing protein [Acidimicrobiales bacterium]
MSPPRILPPLDDRNRAFWTGGRHGQLLIERCPACGRWQHPPQGRCAGCGADAVPTPASGRGTVFTYTVAEHQYHPEVPTPFVIAIVELAEQPDLRVVANVVGCDPADVRIGLPVRVAFEQQGEHHVPVFEPVVEPTSVEPASVAGEG